MEDDNVFDVLLARQEHWQKPQIGNLKISMRSYTVSWMCNNGLALSMHPRTAMMAVSMMDRYASVRQVAVADLEKLAITCLWVSAKYEEIANTYTTRTMLRLANRKKINAQDLLLMEKELLQALDHRLSIPTPFDFMEAICFETFKTVPQLHIPTTMVVRHMIGSPPILPPSKLAATALAVAGCPLFARHASLVDKGLAQEMIVASMWM